MSYKEAARGWLFLALGLVLACIGIAPGRAQDRSEALFEAVPGVDAPRAGYAGRTRLVRLVSSVKQAKIAPDGADQALDRLARAQGLDPALTIAFFPDVTASFRRTQLRTAEDGGYVWSGTAGSRGSATLVVNGDSVSGYAEVDRKAYRIQPVDGSVHRITEIDPSREKRDTVRTAPRPHTAPDAGKSAPDAATKDGKTVVKVLVAYTHRARDLEPQIGMDIELAVQLANEAYAASDVALELQLAGKMLVDYAEGNNWNANLDALTSGEAFKTVRAKRDNLNADLVSLLRAPGSYCGVAWYTPSPSGSTTEQGFSVVGRDCISYHSFAHELGHNIGLQHDRYVAGGGGFNFGYVNVLARIRSIMAYDDRCSAQGVTCTRVKMFSTPREDFQGETIGVGKDASGAADNARKLKSTREAVAAYR